MGRGDSRYLWWLTCSLGIDVAAGQCCERPAAFFALLQAVVLVAGLHLCT